MVIKKHVDDIKMHFTVFTESTDGRVVQKQERGEVVAVVHDKKKTKKKRAAIHLWSVDENQTVGERRPESLR